MEFITSSKGRRKLVIEGYLYCKNKSLTNGSSCWECKERRRKNGCNARVTLDENEEIIKGPSDYKHPPKLENIAVGKIRSNMKRMANETTSSPNITIGDQLQGASGETMAKLPKLDTLRRCIRRQNQEQGRYLPIPNCPDFNIRQEYAIIGEEHFLKYDNGRKDRILIFGIRDSLDYLENSRNWFMDGTFSVSPPQFAQLYTIQWKKSSWSVYFVTKQKIR